MDLFLRLKLNKVLQKLSKYFSLFLILFLVNSNYSFALSHMMCKMNDTNDSCECQHISKQGELRFDSKASECCKAEIKEINNSNTLESNKISLIKAISFTTLHFFEESKLQSVSYFFSQKALACFHPPADIPILFSHILI